MSQGVVAMYWLDWQSVAVDGRNIDRDRGVVAQGGRGGDGLAGGGEPVGRHWGGEGHRAGGVAVQGGGGGGGLVGRGQVDWGGRVVDVGHVGRGLVGAVGREGRRDVGLVAPVVVTLLETGGDSYRSGGTI